MMKSILLVPILFAWCWLPAQSQLRLPESPRNILLFISDGWGYNHITATNYYMEGKDPAQPYQLFPVHYPMSTHRAKSKDKEGVRYFDGGYNTSLAWSDFEYFKQNPTGSAEASTAMSTGKKTYSRSIGMSVTHEELYHITQQAKDIGKSAGVVTSVQLSHATPAGFVAHNINRHNFEEIARDMLLDSRLDLLMGCGHPYYNNNGIQQDTAISYQYVGGKETWKSLQSGETKFDLASNKGNQVVQDIDGDGVPDPWTLIHEKEAFQSLGSGVTPKRILGIPEVHTTLQQERDGIEVATPFTQPINTGVPSLEEMTQGALNALSRNEKGFFLMVEGGAVDWATHDMHGGRMIEEQHDFNNAVKAAIAWIENHGGWEENLLIVTGDHECGYLSGPKANDQSPITNPVINNGKGKMPGMRFNHDEHTNMLIPVYAKGAGSELFHLFADEVDYLLGPYINNTEIAQLMFLLWARN